MRKLITTLLLTVTISLTAAEYKPRQANPSTVRVVPMRPTPEADNVKVYITFPKDDEVVSSGSVPLQMRETGFPLGTKSDFERAKQLYNDPEGQNIRVIIDGLPPFGIYKTFVDSLDDNNLYFEKTLNKKIPFSLKQGQHIIRSFPVRSFGESLKRPGCFAASNFYVNDKDETLEVDLGGPLLTYNEPQGKLPYKKNGAILLDFYLTNTELSKDGYKVRLSIDGGDVRILTDWVPYYLHGLTKGEHEVRLELLDPQNQKVSGAYNDVTKKIVLD